MNIMVACSKKFFPYLTVMLESLYENNREEQITLYLLHMELEKADLELLHEQATTYHNSIIPILIDAEHFNGFPTRQQLPVIVYLRLMAADLLPATVGRVLSLDVDIIVRKSLKDLYNVHLGDSFMAACEDQAYNTSTYKKSLGMPLEQTYFNTGVFLLDIDRMRKAGIGFSSFLTLAQDRGFKLMSLEQDLLNLVFLSKIKGLPCSRYNCSPQYYDRLYGSRAASDSYFGSIIHYLRPDCKPWDSFVSHIGSELQHEWWRYAAKTPFYESLKQGFEKKLTATLAKQNLALKTYYSLALMWLQVEDRQKKLEQYFIGQNIFTVAVYGVNALQDIFCRDLKNTKIRVGYLADSFATGNTYEYEVRRAFSFHDVDAVVVAACAHYKEIYDGLDKTRPIISLEDVIAAIYAI